MPNSITKQIRPLFLLIIISLGLFKAGSLLAHDNTGAAIFVDVSTDRIRLEIEVPLSNLRHELNQPAKGIFLDFPSPKVDEYARTHVKLYDANSQPLALKIRSSEIVSREGKDFQKIEMLAQLSAGISSRDFTVDSDIIIHNRSDKHLMVFLRNDFEAGEVGSVRLVGELSPQFHTLRFNLGKGSWFKGVKATFFMGMHHIAEGSDHLLFLFTLLLTAGLLIHGRDGKIRKWGGIASPRVTFREIFIIVTAFTIGHSLTLLVGALGYNILPSQLVESLIALSILLTAFHAMIPIFPKKEGWIALSFGLVHGLGFAAAIQELGVEGKSLLLTIFGFSLGVEFMQGLLILLILPLIYSIYSGAYGHILRYVGGIFASVMAVAWLTERLTQTEIHFLSRIEEITKHGLYLVFALIATAILSKICSKRQLLPLGFRFKSSPKS